MVPLLGLVSRSLFFPLLSFSSGRLTVVVALTPGFSSLSSLFTLIRIISNVRLAGTLGKTYLVWVPQWADNLSRGHPMFP